MKMRRSPLCVSRQSLVLIIVENTLYYTKFDMVVSLHQTPTPQKTPTPTGRERRRSSSLAKTTRRARSVVLVRCVFVLNRFESIIRERAFWRVFDGFGLYCLRPLRPGWSAFFFLNHTSARLDPPPRGGERRRERRRRRNCGESASSRVTRDAIFSSFGGG